MEYYPKNTILSNCSLYRWFLPLNPLQVGPFVRFADKSTGNEDIVGKMEELIATGIPEIAKKLHDELDRAAGSYLWEFLEGNWDGLQDNLSDPDILERLVRRRASIQIGRLDPDEPLPTEVENVAGMEFYIYPPVSGEEIRLGQILQHKNQGKLSGCSYATLPSYSSAGPK